MAKRQYRVSSVGDWTSNFGYSLIALLNQSGSGRKLTIRQLSAFVLSQKGGACMADMYAGTAPFVGENMVAHRVAMDSATTPPSTVVVRRGVETTVSGSRQMRHNMVRRSGAVATQNVFYSCGMGSRSGARHAFAGAYNRGSTRATTAVEPLTVPQNTGWVVVADGATMTESQPVRVNVVLSIDGKTAVWDFVSVAVAGIGIFSVENTGTAVVKVLSYSFTELGTTDTPFVRMVPIGQNYAADLGDASKAAFTVEKMDSAYPDLTALKVLGDVGFIPSGSPEVVINEGSAGTPKGVNYLHTRDFNGPAYRVFLPEMRAGGGVSSTNDTLGHMNSFRASDLLLRRKSGPVEGIVLNPGEGLALVASSETFIGVQPAYSGWPSLQFLAIIDSEPAQIPVIAATGMVNGSRYRVERVSDGSLVTDGVAGAGGNFSFSYEVEDTPLNMRLKVRKASSAPFYKPYEATFSLTSAGVSVPVSQVADP